MKRPNMLHFIRACTVCSGKSTLRAYKNIAQGSYASEKCQGNLNFFKVRELSGNFMLCQGKMNVFQNVREMSGNF